MQPARESNKPCAKMRKEEGQHSLEKQSEEEASVNRIDPHLLSQMRGWNGRSEVQIVEEAGSSREPWRGLLDKGDRFAVQRRRSWESTTL